MLCLSDSFSSLYFFHPLDLKMTKKKSAESEDSPYIHLHTFFLSVYLKHFPRSGPSAKPLLNKLCIRRGHSFRLVRKLITNFWPIRFKTRTLSRYKTICIFRSSKCWARPFETPLYQYDKSFERDEFIDSCVRICTTAQLTLIISKTICRKWLLIQRHRLASSMAHL